MSSTTVLLWGCAVIACGLTYPLYQDLPALLEYLNGAPIEDQNWPNPSVHFGQVAGIEAGQDDKVYVFHRGSRVWNFETFNADNTFAHPEEGAIKEKTIVTLDAKTGNQLSAMGEDKFYLPHGLSLDDKGNMWVTDVGLHQVMRFPKGSKDPDMVLGKKLVPGNDATHFCKPTDVAVASTGVFFVADGYCNSRVMKFYENGTLDKQWGEKVDGKLTDMSLNVPHSLTLVESDDMVCVADREDGRVQCYNAGLKDPSKAGQFLYTLISGRGNIYAIKYDPTGDVMYAVVNPVTTDDGARGYTLAMDGTVLHEWWPQDGQPTLPHDVSVSPDGSTVYAGDIAGKRIVRFESRQSVGYQ